MLSESITRACKLHGDALIAFVYMPEHVHLRVYPQAKASPIQRFLFAIKRPFAYRVTEQLQAHNSPLLEKLTIRQRPGVMTFRYSKEGPGDDRNLNEPASSVTHSCSQ
jgi:putative transposase